jgi:hypothetical protein
MNGVEHVERAREPLTGKGVSFKNTTLSLTCEAIRGMKVRFTSFRIERDIESNVHHLPGLL